MSRIVSLNIELPTPLKVVGRARHHERSRRLDHEDRKRGASAYRNRVARLQVLELRQNPTRARCVEIPEQAIERVVAIQGDAWMPIASVAS
jgi:hypothetical protein